MTALIRVFIKALPVLRAQLGRTQDFDELMAAYAALRELNTAVDRLTLFSGQRCDDCVSRPFEGGLWGRQNPPGEHLP